jgi:O-antigen/teichoic acid export membrane protein
VVFTSLYLSEYFFATQGYVSVFIFLGFTIMFAGLYQTLSGILVGQEKVKELAKLDTIRFILQQSLAAGLVYAGWRLHGIVAGWAAGFAFFAIAVFVALRLWRGSAKNRVGLSSLLRFSAPLCARDLLAFAYNWVDRLLILLYVPLSSLGVYNVAFIAFGIIASTPDAIATALFPHFSKLSNNRKAKLESSITRASRYLALIVSPMALGLAALAPTLMKIFGPAYAIGATPLTILSLSLFATLSLYSLGSILIALNRPAQQSLITIASIVVTFTSGVLLIPWMGINGGAMARGFGMVASLIVAVWLVRGQIRLEFDRSAIWASTLASSGMALLVFSVELFLKSALFLPLYILAGAIAYLGLLRIQKTVKKSDLELFEAFAGPKLAPTINRIGKWLAP